MFIVACHCASTEKPQNSDSWHTFLKLPRLPERGDQPFRLWDPGSRKR
jgi:hypothetical protein